MKNIGVKLNFKFAILLFSSVSILGESFKISIGSFKISLAIILSVVFIVSSIISGIKFYIRFNDKIIYFFALLVTFYAIYGFFQGNDVGDIFEDAYPLVMLCVFYCIFRNFNVQEIFKVWQSLLVLGVICSIKVLIINLLPVTIEWDNNWQATKESIPFSSAFRIILRGGDLFISIAFVAVIIKSQFVGNKIIKLMVPFILLLYALFVSLSRSSYLADVVAIFLIVFLYNKFFSKNRLIAFLTIFVAFIIMALPFIDLVSTVSSVFEARTEAFDQGNVAMEFRSEEQNLIYSKASRNYYLGGGLGSFFYLPYSGSEKGDGRSIYTHDFNAWLIFKMGFLSLVVFYLLFGISCFNYHQLIKKQGNIKSIEIQQLPIFLLASGFVFIMISFWANKLNTFSGSLFFSFFAAAPYVLRKKYISMKTNNN